MKSKPTTYLLLIAVLAVWGIIAWKILFSRQEVVPAPPSDRPLLPETEVRDTLVLRYRDPFLGEASTKTPHKPSASTRKPPASAPVPKPFVEHYIRYLGSITKGKTTHALLEIEGVLYTLRVGECAGGYTLKAILPGSIRVNGKGENCQIEQL